jgi:hypothetical protein
MIAMASVMFFRGSKTITYWALISRTAVFIELLLKGLPYGHSRARNGSSPFDPPREPATRRYPDQPKDAGHHNPLCQVTRINLEILSALRVALLWVSKPSYRGNRPSLVDIRFGLLRQRAKSVLVLKGIASVNEVIPPAVTGGIAKTITSNS